MNPYTEKNFFEFFVVLGQRLWMLLSGKVSFSELAPDEVQMVVLSLIAISCALVGTFLVLKKMTMVANSLSHTVLLGVVVSYLVLTHLSPSGEFLDGISFTGLVLAALITGVVTTVATQMLTTLMKLPEDASIGLVFTTIFALGIVLVTLYTRNVHLGIEAVTGNVDALHFDDMASVLWVFLLNFGLIFLFFKEYKIIAFDASLARSMGIHVAGFQYLLMVQTAATAIGAFRAVGVLLFLALLVGPVLTARLMTHHLKKMIAIAAIIGVISGIIAVALSRHFFTVHNLPLSTAGILVAVIAIIYIGTIVYKNRRAYFLKMKKQARLPASVADG